MSDSPPAWAQGHDLAFLQEAARIFKEELGPFCHGAFGLPKENAIAQAMSDSELLWTREKCRKGEPLGACALAHRASSSRVHEGFDGRQARIMAADIHIRAIAGSESGKLRLLERLLTLEPAALWLEGHLENAPLREMMERLGFQLQLIKVAASSDLKGLWLRAKGRADAPRGAGPIAKADIPALSILQEDFISEEERAEMLQEAEAASWADHYSGYNKRHSWSAFALRGFDARDPSFIEKPAEMSKAWKVANPERLAAPCGDTIAAQLFPCAMRVAGRIPGHKQRVRLMRLAPEGGELTRHADITDPEAGTGPGKLCRLHIPLITSPDCHFRGWGLDGQMHEANFPERSLCYLDTRKPHAARNNGQRERIHLVVDAFASGALRAMIAAQA